MTAITVTPLTIGASTMQTATLTTEPFTCPSCVAKIEKTLGKMDGVSDVDVMFHSNKVKVAFDETAQNVETLADTVTKLGYPVLRSKVA